MKIMRLTGVPDGLLHGLPDADQAAIRASVGQPVLVTANDEGASFAPSGTCEAMFQAAGSMHFIWVEPCWLEEYPTLGFCPEGFVPADSVTDDGLSNEAIDAATDDLEVSGNLYGWWPEETKWRDLDPISRDEFAAVAANIIRAYFRKLKEIS